MSIKSKLLRVGLFGLGVCTIGGLITGVVAYGIFSQGLPEFERIEDYRPKAVTLIYGQEGQLIGELYREKRFVLPYERIPPPVVQAFLASEDDRFFEHSGIDYWGIVRAAFANLRAGRVVQGGSTVTQQVAKSLIISAEGYGAGSAKKLSRKIREAILARRLERNLTKQEILTLYLNQIFLGNQSYGVEAAAQNYFRKPLRQLNTAEIALLAGLPQAPSRYSPFRHPKRAKDRREYVLRRLLEEGFIDQKELDDAKDLPIEVYPAPDVSRNVTPYFTEQVRRELFDMYDEKQVLEEGLQVFTTVDVERYRAAEDATYENLRMVDKRQGYRGPLIQYKTAEEQNNFLKKYTEELAYLGRKDALQDGELYLGLITKKTDNELAVSVGPHKVTLPLAAMRWARKVNPNSWFESMLLRSIPKTFAKGDVILVRKTTFEKIRKDPWSSSLWRKLDKKGDYVQLEQEPNLESALLSQDVDSGYVIAMLGGYSFERSEFNRALQSCRQPGSSFKPIVYSAALVLDGWSPSSTVLDAPLAFNDASAQNRWKPSNFNSKFMGEVTIRTALQNSMNVPSIKVLQAVGRTATINYAKTLGIDSELRDELGLALGSSCIKMAELVNAYSVFASGGLKIKRRFITRVLDRDGKLLYDNGWPKDPWAGVGQKIARAVQETETAPERIIDRGNAFVITKMMRNVVTGGTGTGAQRVGVPVAGKTGTTNDSFDAWFSGFTPNIVTSAWVGYDDYVLPMGKYEQGGRAALPIWVDYMKKAVKKKSGDFEPPPEVVFIRIDPKTGQRARPDTIGAVREAFVRGTAPKEFVARAGEAKSDAFFMIDN